MQQKLVLLPRRPLCRDRLLNKNCIGTDRYVLNVNRVFHVTRLLAATIVAVKFGPESYASLLYTYTYIKGLLKRIHVYEYFTCLCCYCGRY